MPDEITNSYDTKKQNYLEPKTHKRFNKNTPKDIDLNLKAYQLFEGTDSLAIESIACPELICRSFSTVLYLVSEVGPDGIQKFKTAKHFASCLRLAPSNKVSGEKLLPNRVPKGKTRIKIALRSAANPIGNQKNLLH